MNAITVIYIDLDLHYIVYLVYSRIEQHGVPVDQDVI